MKITKEHKNIGTAVMQIAEHDKFTAINRLKLNGQNISNGFLINSHMAVLCKYATYSNSLEEFTFKFHGEQLANINALCKKHEALFFGLVCVDGKEICCLSKEQFQKLVKYRQLTTEQEEDSLDILVTARSGDSLRAYVNAAGRKNTIAEKALVIPRNAFPKAIFDCED